MSTIVVDSVTYTLDTDKSVVYVDGINATNAVIAGSVTIGDISHYVNEIRNIGTICTTLTFGPSINKTVSFAENKTLQTVILNDSLFQLPDNMFKNCSGLTSITLGDSLTSIPDYCFYGCTSFKYLTDVKNVTTVGISAFESSGLVNINSWYFESIGDACFKNCKSLVDVALHVKTVPSYCFYGCTSLTSIEFLAQVEKLEDSSFESSGLTTINLVNISSLGSACFKSCTKVTSVTLSDVLSYIPAYCFSGCALTEIDLKNVISIENNAFESTLLTRTTGSTTIDLSKIISLGSACFKSCAKVTSVTLSDVLSYIPSYCFSGCALTEINLKNVNKLENNAFEANPLTTIDLSKIISLGSACFKSCTKVTSVTLSDVLSYIPAYCFSGCALTEIDLKNVISIENNAFESTLLTRTTGSTTIDLSKIISLGSACFKSCAKVTSVTLSDVLSYIPSYCFSGCALTEINLKNVNKLENNAFEANPLTTIDLSKIISLGSACFKSCAKVTSVTLSDVLLTIPSYCFSGCALTEINLKNVNKLENNAFETTLLTNTTGSTTMDLSNIISIGSACFKSCKFFTSVLLSDVLLTIPSYCFSGCIALTEIGLKNVNKLESNAFESTLLTRTTDSIDPATIDLSKITFIGSSCFKLCKNFTTVILSDSLQTIPDFCFYTCSKLSRIDLKNVEIIGNSSFQSTALTEVNLINIKFLNGGACFNSCKSLYKISNCRFGYDTVNKGFNFVSCPITEIDLSTTTLVNTGPGDFNGCTKLITVILPTAITKISFSTFSSCTKLETIDLSNIAVISYGAFNSCSNLTNVNLPNLTTIEDGDGGVSPNYHYGAFQKSGITTLENMDKIMNIGAYAFNEATSLSYSLNTNSPSLVKIGTYAFYNTQIIIPTINNSNLTISRSGLGKIMSIEKIVVESIKSLDSSAFSGCTNVTDIDLRLISMTENLSCNAFTKLKTFLFPKMVETFPAQGFKACGALKEIVIPSTVKSLSSGSLFEGAGIVSIDLSNTLLDSIPSYTFSTCSNLITVKLPETLKKILSSAFEDTTSLKTITIPNSVTLINAYTFTGSGLTTLTYLNEFTGTNLFPNAFPAENNILATVSPNVWANYKNNSSVTPISNITRYKPDSILTSAPPMPPNALIFIRKDSIAPNYPNADIAVKPNHSIRIGKRTIPAKLFVNGNTIRSFIPVGICRR